jgi:DNA-binding NarL/FixJ family response regulator
MTDIGRTVRVVILDAFPITRWGLRAALINSNADIDVIGQADSIAELLDMVEAVHPDIVLVGVLLDGSPVDVVQALPEEHPPRVVALLEKQGLGGKAFLDAGGQGCISMDCAPGEIVSAVKAVAEGKQWVSANVAECMEKYIVDWKMACCTNGESD